jgi:phosphoribosyl 1,2-cyclic phosphate phosphodiesterase
MLYANDTGYFPEETWEYLKNAKIKYDFISLDCTCILDHCRDGHMSIDVDDEVRNRLIEIGCADKNTVFCVNHFSHNGKATYDELIEIAEKYNFLVSYDSMEIEF